MINDITVIEQTLAAEETKFAKEKQALIKLVLGIGITSSAIIGTVTAFYTSLILADVVSTLILAITAAVCFYISMRKFQDQQEETVRSAGILPAPSNEPEDEQGVLLNELYNVPPNELAGLAYLADIVQRLEWHYYSREDNNGINCNININTDILLPIGDALTSAALMSRNQYMLQLSYQFYDNSIIDGRCAKSASLNVVKSIYCILESSSLLSKELLPSLLQACLSERHASENFKQIILNELPQTTQRCFETLCKHVNMNPLRDFSELSEARRISRGNWVLDRIKDKFEEAAREHQSR